MGDNKLQQVYDFRSLGVRVLLGEMDQINTKMKEIRENKIALNRIKTVYVEDPQKIKEAEQRLTELIVKEKELQVELRKKSIQAKEAQLIHQQELAQRRALKDSNSALAGSYNEINKRYQELLNISKNTTNLLNPKEVQEATNELKQLKSVLDNFTRSMTKDGTLVGEYTSGIINAFKRLGLGDVIEAEINQGKNAAIQLDQIFDRLTVDMREMQRAGVTGLNAIQSEMIQNRQEAERLRSQIQQMENALRGAGTIGEQITRGLKDGLKNAKQEAISFFVAYLGFQQALSAAQATIRSNSIISDQLTDLQRVMQVTDESISNIERNIRGLETRTGFSKLLDFALIGAKAGTLEKDIAGVTKAIDELQLVAGKELGSNIDKTVSSVVKLINIFEGPNQVNENNIRRYGNALVELANKGVATGEFLIDYAERLAGIEGLTKIQIQSVLGLAAAYEEQGASAEVAATATTQILLKVNANIPKYAELAKLSEDTFRTLVRNNPAEALLQLAEGVKGNTKFFDEFAQLFPELEAKGVRVASTFGIMADKADFFRDKISIAGTAIKDVTAISEGAERKQNNFAATIANIRKEFELIGTNKAVQVVLYAIAGAISLIIGNIGPIITLLGLYSAAWGIANAEMIRARASTIASNVVFRVQYAWLVLTEQATKAYAAALTIYTNRQNAATAAQVLWNQVVLANPAGAALATLGLLVAALTVFDAVMDSNNEKVREQAAALSAMSEVTVKAAAATVEETTKLKILVEVAANAKNSYDTRKKAIDDLIKQYPQFSKALSNEAIDVRKLRDAYLEVVSAIRLKSETQASADLAAEKQKSVLDIVSLRQRIETEATIQGGGQFNRVSLANISDEDRKLLLGGFFGNSLSNNSSIAADGSGGINFFQQDTQKIVAFLKAEEDKRTKVYQSYIDVSTRKQAELSDYQQKLDAQLKSTLETKADSGDLTISQLKDLIEAIDKENLLLKESDPKLKENLERKEKLQERLDAALGKKTKSQREQEAADKKAARQERFETRNLQGMKKFLDAESLDKFKKELDELEADKIELEAQARDLFNTVDNDPLASDSEKAAASANYYNTLLNIQIAYNSAANNLEEKYAQQSAKNEAKRMRDMLKARGEANKAVLDSSVTAQENELKEIQERYEEKVGKIFNDIATGAADIFSGDNGSARDKKKRVKLLEDSFNQQMFDAEMQRISEEETQYKFMLDNKLITEQVYNEKKRKLDQDRYNAWKKYNDSEIAEEDKKQQRRNKAFGAALNIADTYASGLINGQRQIIEENYNEAASYLEKERQKRLAQATSKAEEEAIELEFDQRRRELDKKRGEERKELAKKQLAIEFALASIKAISTSTDFYDGLLNAGIVLGEYLAKLAVIDQQQFEYGGRLTKDGGVAGGKRHGLGGMRFSYAGSGYEAEADEMFIINRNSSLSGSRLSVTGTPKQIASAINAFGGGVNFAPGAAMNNFDYTGGLGSSLGAPYFSPGGSDMSDLRQMIGNMYASVSILQGTILRLQVHMSTGDAVTKINSYQKAVSISKL